MGYHRRATCGDPARAGAMILTDDREGRAAPALSVKGHLVVPADGHENDPSMAMRGAHCRS